MNDTRQVATVVTLAAIIGIVFYAAGYGHASSRATGKERQMENAARMQQSRLLAIRNRSDLLAARVALYQAQGAISRLDPAMASDRIEEASSDLAAVNASAANVDANRLSKVQSQLHGFQASGTVDPDAQLSQVQALGKELDRLISTPVAVPAAP
ncbi:MAG: hypothetical protein ACYDHM_08850 [Acidiferrobacterales bacterium]